jgi:hypothetical protein
MKSRVRTWVTDAFTKDLGLKGVSLALAVFAYVLVHGGQDVQRTFSLDLEIIPPQASQNRVLLTTVPPKARAILQGPRNVLDELSADNLGAITLDLRKGNDTHVVFEPSRVRVPTGVKVMQIEPSSLNLEWDDRVTREVPVRVQTRGTLATGLAFGEAPQVKPLSVRIAGPQGVVASTPFVRTESVDIASFDQGDHERALVVEAPGPRVDVEPRTVAAIIHVVAQKEERVFPRVRVQVTGQNKARVTPAEIEVRLRCASRIAATLRPELIVPRVDITSKETTGSASIHPALAIDGCEASTTPSEVIVRW